MRGVRERRVKNTKHGEEKKGKWLDYLFKIKRAPALSPRLAGNSGASLSTAP